jgi:hypothetical protein
VLTVVPSRERIESMLDAVDLVTHRKGTRLAVLSQLRNIDSQRLIEKKGHVPPDMLALLKKEASRMNFG